MSRANLPSDRPRFAWDTVPVFMHSYWDLSINEQDAAYFARFPLVTMAGYAGKGKGGGRFVGFKVRVRLSAIYRFMRGGLRLRFKA